MIISSGFSDVRPYGTGSIMGRTLVLTITAVPIASLSVVRIPGPSDATVSRGHTSRVGSC